MTKVDILIIGAGMAGEYAAGYAAGKAEKVGLVERSKVGGACVFNACIPSKAMVHAARTYKKMKGAGFFGLPEYDKEADYKQVKAFKDGIISGIAEGREERMSKKGIRLFKGTARFISPHETVIGNEHVEADKIIITTGSVPAVPPIKGLEKTGYITHIGALKLEKLPGKTAVLGGGPVGVEFTQIFSAFGSKIHIFERGERIVAMEDEDISNGLSGILIREGISVSTGVEVTEVRSGRKGKNLVFKGPDGKEHTEDCDEILVATGRMPQTDGLHLSAAGVGTDSKGIKVDDTLRTNVPHIWAAGDAAGPPYFTYVSGEQARAAVLNAMGEGKEKLSYDILPTATFCDPEIGSVGLTEKQAREQGYAVKAGIFSYADMTRPIVSNETDGFVKIVAEEKSGRILGGHILGAEASTLIHEIAAAMAGNLTVSDVGNVLHAYPAFSEAVRYACQSIT